MVNTGKTLFRRNDEIEWAFLVREGQNSLLRSLQDDGRLTLHRVGEENLTAKESLFAKHHNCDAVPDLVATVAVLPKAQLLAKLHRTFSGNHLAVSAFKRTAKELRTL